MIEMSSAGHHPALPGLRRDVAVADGRGGDHRPPERVAERGAPSRSGGRARAQITISSEVGQDQRPRGVGQPDQPAVDPPERHEQHMHGAIVPDAPVRLTRRACQDGHVDDFRTCRPAPTCRRSSSCSPTTRSAAPAASARLGEVDAAYWAAFEAIDADPRNELIVADDAGAVVGTCQLTFTPSLSRARRRADDHRGGPGPRATCAAAGVGRAMMRVGARPRPRARLPAGPAHHRQAPHRRAPLLRRAGLHRLPRGHEAAPVGAQSFLQVAVLGRAGPACGSPGIFGWSGG